MENKAKIDPKRFGILKAYQKGETIPDITAKFRHISRATIYRWIKEFKKGRVCRNDFSQVCERSSQWCELRYSQVQTAH